MFLYQSLRVSHSNPKMTDCITVILKNIFIYNLVGLPVVYLVLKLRVTFDLETLPSWYSKY